MLAAVTPQGNIPGMPILRWIVSWGHGLGSQRGVRRGPLIRSLRFLEDPEGQRAHTSCTQACRGPPNGARGPYIRLTPDRGAVNGPRVSWSSKNT